MTDKIFLDTNLVIYALTEDGVKSARAIQLLTLKPTISVQVVNETINVLTKKYKFAIERASKIAIDLLDLCEITPMSASTIRLAIALRARFSLSHWDSLIVAAAQEAHCATLYSEDLQEGQAFDGLSVTNPFNIP